MYYNICCAFCWQTYLLLSQFYHAKYMKLATFAESELNM